MLCEVAISQVLILRTLFARVDVGHALGTLLGILGCLLVDGMLWLWPEWLGEGTALPDVHLGGQAFAKVEIAQAQRVEVFGGLEIVQAASDFDDHAGAEHDLAVVQRFVQLEVHVNVARGQIGANLLQYVHLILWQRQIRPRRQSYVLQVATTLDQHLKEVNQILEMMLLAELRLVQMRLLHTIIEVSAEQTLIAPPPRIPLNYNMLQHFAGVQMHLDLITQLIGSRLVHLQVFVAELLSLWIRTGQLIELEDALLVEQYCLHNVTRLLALDGITDGLYLGQFIFLGIMRL